MSCGAPLEPGSGTSLCISCADGFEPVIECCPLCGTPEGPYVDGGARCESCTGRKVHFTAARGAFKFNGPVRQLIHRLKYEGLAAASRPLGSMAAARLVAGVFGQNPRFDALVPVPSGFWQRFRRGYNQSELIAREMSKHCGVPVVKALSKTRATDAQVGLPKEARLKNVRGAFRAAGRLVPKGATLLVVDDVITTSSTVSECAKALLDAGAGEVFAFSIARQP